MIEDFLASWALFHNAYLAALLIAAALALVGVFVVARDQIFLGAAVSQASMLGIAIGILATDALAGAADAHTLDIVHSLFGGVAAVGGALLTVGPRARYESREAITGWVFLVGASLSVLLVAHSPHGLAEVNRLLASTVIGAHRADVYLLGALLAVTAAVIAGRRDALLLLVSDPEMADALGVRVRLWDRILAVWLGVVVAFALHVAGMLYTFALLVLPGLTAKHLCREGATMFILAPLLSIAAVLLSLILANHYDYPPAQVSVAALCLCLSASWAAPLLSRR